MNLGKTIDTRMLNWHACHTNLYRATTAVLQDVADAAGLSARSYERRYVVMIQVLQLQAHTCIHITHPVW